MTHFFAIKHKKLLYNSNYRGCRESEIIFRNFVDKNLSSLSQEELNEYEQFLNFTDAEILDWLVYEKQPPIEVQRMKVYQLIKNSVARKQ
jgi:succinate dehydrogenase flavin-adding protein (antitoxin of CptAB toxin-antitoxin module)